MVVTKYWIGDKILSKSIPKTDSHLWVHIMFLIRGGTDENIKITRDLFILCTVYRLYLRESFLFYLIFSK